MLAIGITGTDTGVGKTVVSCALARAFVLQGKRVGVMKPVETGVGGWGLGVADSERLALASGSGDAPDVICPYRFSDPVAPLAAARRVGAQIELERLDDAFAAVSKDRDVVIVEGAGGLLTPITESLSFDGLFAVWNLRVLLVAQNRLGVLNHSLLTLRALAAASLSVRAVVLNDDERPDDSSAENAVLLRERAPHIPIVHFPRVARVDDLDSLADAAQPLVNALQSLHTSAHQP